MIQFNLLPEVKIKYLKVKRTRRLIITIAAAVGGTSLAITLGLLIFVQGIQRTYMNDLSNRIASDSDTLQSIEDLDRILTVQNQLQHLPALHEKKAALSRVQEYLPILTPDNVSYAKIDIDLASSKITFTGTADALVTVNKFVDTLKFAKYSAKGADGATEEGMAFKNVVLASFGRDGTSASYQITLDFEPIIFDNTRNEVTGNPVSLVVERAVTTRSVADKAGAQFFEPFVDPENQLITEDLPRGGQ